MADKQAEAIIELLRGIHKQLDQLQQIAKQIERKRGGRSQMTPLPGKSSGVACAVYFCYNPLARSEALL